MRTNRSQRGTDVPQLEPLENRLLLSGDSLAGATEALAVDSASIAPPAVEQESIGGPSNNDAATAEELSFSYLVPKVSPVDGFGPQQASVLGTADGGGAVGYYENEKGVLFTNPLEYPFTFDFEFEDAVSPSGGGLLTITATAEPGGLDKYLTIDAEGLFQTDLFVEDGLTDQRVEVEITLTREQIAALAADGQIVFTLIPSESVIEQGALYVMMELTYGAGGGTGDFYQFDMAAEQSASLSLVGSEASELTMTVYDAAGVELAVGQVGTDGAVAVEHLLATSDGSYYVCISGSGDYELVVNRNAATDLAGNDSLVLAQQIESSPLAGRQWVIGEIDDGETDFYAVQVGGGKWLDVRTYTPDSEAGPNALEPIINIYDADGNLVATGSGRMVRYRVPSGAGETYYVEVVGGGSTEGDYVLSLKVAGSQAKGEKMDAAGLKGPQTPLGRALGRRGN